jgi:signal transduction histidine kinase
VTQALSIMRVLQEALSNIVRHSRATSVTIATAERVHDGRPGVEVRVSDNGAGFDVTLAQQYGRGLRNMRERAMSLGGHLSVESVPGASTIGLWLPLQPAPAELPRAVATA